jgi:hypothetical protein
MKRSLIVALLCASCGGSAVAPAEFAPNEGKSGGPCYPNNTCNSGLSCVATVCVEPADVAPAADASIDTAVEDTADVAVKAPYVVTSITAACDEAMLLDVAGVDGDDSASNKSSLPLSFRFFGDDVSYWSMSSNGFAQLWPSVVGAADKTAENAAIPTAAQPNGLVAPFWDDLVPIFSNARAGLLGTTPNRRFVISWVHWSIKGQTGTIRVSFQVKLFETTHAIEFHYCGMQPAGNALASGSSATIGLENLAGTVGIQQSFDTAAAVASGKAFRFTP